jgi:hypothetical protein
MADLTRRFRIFFASDPVGRYGPDRTCETILQAEDVARALVREHRKTVEIWDTSDPDWLAGVPAATVRLDAYDRVWTDVSYIKPLL